MANKNGGFIGTDGLDAPDAPTGVTPTAGVGSVSIAFTDAEGGTSATTSFVAQVSTDDTDYSTGSGTGSSSPIEITGLTGGTAHTAKVWAINAYGTSAPSKARSFTPAAARGIFAGGDAGAGGMRNDIRYFTLASTGNTTDFGDLSAVRQRFGNSGASSTRGIFSGGKND